MLHRWLIGAALTLFAATACKSARTADDAGPIDAGFYAGPCAPGSPCGPAAPNGPAHVSLTMTTDDTQFDVMDHMIAAVEMQISGEPLAQDMGRQLTGYSRDFLPPNIYFTPSLGQIEPWTDLVGFGTAVESYEYSKQPMNDLNLESGAGISLLFGPLINPGAATGMDALTLAQTEIQHFAALSNLANSGFASWNKTLMGESNALGWPGLWPAMQPYSSFDPRITPTNAIDWLCSIASDDSPGAQGAVLNEDYECDYTTLNLPHRSAQVNFVLTPGSSGWAGWKSALWTVNYLQIMHDALGTAVAAVQPSDMVNVGVPDNDILGEPSTPGTMTVTGTYLGSSTIEGFQAAMMIEEIDNAAQQWLTSLTTTDGATLTGFDTILDGISYDYTSPLRWIPAQIAVTEIPDPSGFPNPSAYTIQSSDSSLLDLLGMLGSYSTFYALTDTNNANIGGTQPVEVYFDGDPFPADDQLPDGERTLHDRALALMRLIVVDLDRIHRDPASGILSDDVVMRGGMPSRSTTLDSASAAYVLVALRNVRRALGSELSLYSNTTPDTATSDTPLDAVPLNGAPSYASSFSQLLTTLITTHAELFYNQLTTADGHALQGWDFSANAPTTTSDNLDAYTAAIRGLLQAYLCTGDTRYRDRAVTVFDRMDTVFCDPAARVYNTSPGPVTAVAYTPRRFSMLEGALRDLFELWAVNPGNEVLAGHLQDLLARHIKLILNGWDDANGDGLVQYPAECTQIANGKPAGGLQMAERALSGELGSESDRLADASLRVITTDRDQDCVPDIAAAGLPSALANQITLTVKQ